MPSILLVPAAPCGNDDFLSQALTATVDVDRELYSTLVSAIFDGAPQPLLLVVSIAYF